MILEFWLQTMAVVFLLHGSNSTGTRSVVLKQIQQNANFHFNELKRSLEDIRALQEETDTLDDIESRSLNEDFDWKKLIGPILTFCETLKGFQLETNSIIPTSTTTTTAPSTTTISPQWEKDAFVLSTERIVIDETSEGDVTSPAWLLPQVRLVRAQAERNGTKVRVIFDVLHPGPAVVARVQSFQFAKADLTTPFDEEGTFLSRVQFVTDASVCSSGKFEFEELYVFNPKDDETNYSSTQINVDTCGFDKYQNISLDYSQRIWLTKEGSIEQTVRYPKIRIISGPKDRIVLKPHTNEIIDVEVHFIHTTTFFIYASGYDYDSNKRIRYGKVINSHSIQSGKLHLENTGKETNIPFQLDIVKMTNLSADAVGEEGKPNITVTLRITILTTNVKWNGKLMLHMYKTRDDYYMRNVLTSLQSVYVRTIDLPGLQFPPSDLKPFILDRKRFHCTEEGDKTFPRAGRNCTVNCRAYGDNITRISITKTDSQLIPIRSVSYVLSNSAFSKIDVGPASHENQGSYLCVVESMNGAVQSLPLTLYTTGFPKISENETSLVQFNNGTTAISCTATGMHPLNLTIIMKTEHGPYERVDNNRSYNTAMERLDHGMRLTLHLPTKDLKYPSDILSCDVRNDIGSDIKPFFLYNEIDDYYESVVPKLDSDLVRIHNYHNGTTAITCGASGAYPLDIWVTYGGRGEYYRIDNSTANSKVQTMTPPDGKIATVFVRTQSIQGRTSWLHCIAQNQYGHDILDFDLDRYL